MNTTLLNRAARLAGIAGVALVLLSAEAFAAKLQLLPLRLNIRAPEVGDTLTLRNNEKRPLTVQVRIFRSVKANGKEKLVATTDVVVSPPITSLRPGADYTVRVVRMNKQPVQAKESYRLIVDELPDTTQQAGGKVNFAVRYSLPVSFLPAGQ